MFVTSTTQKPASVAQIVSRVNNTLDAVSKLENSFGAKSPTAKKVTTLPRLHPNITTADLIALRNTLTQFPYDGLYLSDSKDALKNLATDLEYIQIFNEAGVKGLNKYLEDILNNLRSAKSEQEKNELIEKLHMFIYRGIYNFPHVVKGVEIILRPGAYEGSKEFGDRFGSDYYRYKYTQLVDALQKEGREVTNSLTIELPYSFTTGTHGSGERAARGASVDNLEFTTIGSWGRKNKERATGLGIAIEVPLIVWKLSYFTLDEIEAVRFTTNGNFTPYLKDEETLLNRSSYINHYLWFRDFSGCSIDLQKLGSLNDQEAKELRKFVFPLRVRNLFDEEHELSGTKLKKGFLAKIEDSKVVLYEIDNLKIGGRDSDSWEDAYKLALKIIRGEIKDPSSIKVYTGDDVINRLTEINIEQRRF
ncbi:MAG: hypothetical protein HYY52_00420 [Candidatus Melainabacteria bacterium]|nr:hypothetical protein [Candidatus Melainabacteria bacterium]